MSHNLIALFLAATLGQFPGGGGGGTPYGGGAVQTAPNSTQSFGTGDPTYPYDYEPNWTHGYFQDIPSYGGYHFFRPYNYKHVLPQSQTAAAWGISPSMPISHSNFNQVNGVPTTSRSASKQYGAEDLRSQFAKIDRQRSNSGARRQGPVPMMTQGSYQPNVMQTQHRQPRRLSRADELRQQMERLQEQLDQEEAGQ